MEKTTPLLMALQSFKLLDADGNFTGHYSNEAATPDSTSPRNFYETMGEIRGLFFPSLERNDKPFHYMNVAASGLCVDPVNLKGTLVPTLINKEDFLQHIILLEPGVIIQYVQRPPLPFFPHPPVFFTQPLCNHPPLFKPPP